MTLFRRSRRGRATTFSVLLLAVVWLAASVAPVAAGTRTYHPGARFSVDTDLTSKSGLSAWAIDRFLAASTPLPPIGAAFMAAERTYGINARYLLAHAMLESGFGTSDIARYAHNLFGYHAFDRDPWLYATRFPSYAKGIDAVAKAIATDYLDPHGRFWGGAPTLRGMHYYASDPNWAQKIVAIANSLVLPTLSQGGTSFGPIAVVDPVVAGALVTIHLGVHLGAGVPPGLRFVVRWRPLAIVEADPTDATEAPASAALTAPAFGKPITGSWHGSDVDLAVGAPTTPGRYALDVTVRDTDGAPLPDATRLAIASVIVQVYAGQAVSYDAASTTAAVHFVATNLGPAAVRDTVSDAGHEPNIPTATLVAWVIPLSGGAPVQVAHVALASDLAVGAKVATDVSSATLAALLPAVAVVRLIPAGLDPIEVGPPGVFRLDPIAVPGGPIGVAPLDPLDPASDALLAGPAAKPAKAGPVVKRGPDSPPAPILLSVSSGADGAIRVSSPIAPANGPDSTTGSTDDASVRGAIALVAVPVSGAAATPFVLGLPFAPSATLRPGDPLGGTIPLGLASGDPGAYLAVVRIKAVHGDGTAETVPVVFWLIVPDTGGTASAVPGPAVATPATTDPTVGTPPPPLATVPPPSVKPSLGVKAVAPAPKPKPTPKPKPRAPRYRIHVVRAGETLWRIAANAGVSVATVRQLNPFVNRYGIHPGDMLRLPG
jgi:LysM repeat protein